MPLLFVIAIALLYLQLRKAVAWLSDFSLARLPWASPRPVAQAPLRLRSPSLQPLQVLELARALQLEQARVA